MVIKSNLGSRVENGYPNGRGVKFMFNNDCTQTDSDSDSRKPSTASQYFGREDIFDHQNQGKEYL